MTYYSKNLARRLIDGKSASEDAERAMIEKLKVCCVLFPLWLFGWVCG
jgi:hypothetical protein